MLDSQACEIVNNMTNFLKVEVAEMSLKIPISQVTKKAEVSESTVKKNLCKVIKWSRVMRIFCLCQENTTKDQKFAIALLIILINVLSDKSSRIFMLI